MVNTQNLTTKEFWQKITIRTMKKDIAALREADTVKERDKIRNFAPPAKQSIKPQVQNTATQAPRPVSQAIIKNQATEEEKQKMFLLQKEREILANQSEQSDLAKGALLAKEKARLALEEKEAQAKIDRITKETEANEVRQKNAPEKETLALEEQKKNMEKRQWVLERQAKNLQDNIKTIDQTHQASTQKRQATKNDIENIDQSLGNLYTQVAQREQQKKEEALLQSSQKTNPPPVVPPPALKKAHYLEGVSEKAKEKLAQTASVEERQRKKFMEDVEAWVNENQ